MITEIQSHSLHSSNLLIFQLPKKFVCSFPLIYYLEKECLYFRYKEGND